MCFGFLFVKSLLYKSLRMQRLWIYVIYSKHLIKNINRKTPSPWKGLENAAFLLCHSMFFVSVSALPVKHAIFPLIFSSLTSAFNELKTYWHLLSRVERQVRWWSQLWPVVEIIIVVAMTMLAYDQEQRHPRKHTSQTGGSSQRTVNANSERDNSLFALSFKYFEKLMTFAKHMSSISLR